MKSLKSVLLGLGASALLSVQSAMGATVVAGFNSSSLSANDDGSTGLLSLGFSANFFGTTYTQVYANNNGNVTFTGPLGTFTPFNLYTTGTPIIAPFFADVDTRGAASDLMRFGTGTFGGRDAFGVTWSGVGVGYFPSATDKLNNFQLLLVDRSDTGAGNFDIYFNYDKITWETGGASGGASGLGGSSARAGFSNGTAANSFEIAGSAVNGAFLDSNAATGLIHSSNIGVDGRFRFEVRNGNIVIDNVPDSGSTLALLGLALVGVAALRRKLR